MTHSKSGKEKDPKGKYLAGLSLAALGIVFGDIGTSPLYAFRESFHPAHGIPPTPENVLGILSLILWSLILVISVKYVSFILRADNNGEGGIIALTALISPRSENTGTKLRKRLILAGLFGAALLYGDSMITPAITVLSAVEGLNVATHIFQPYIIPITIGILLVLFFFQSHGTAGIGKVFGPVMVIWFTTLAAIGVYQIIQAPEVFRAINPLYGIEFFIRNGLPGFFILGSVVLAVTGAEVMYADIGHFGTKPIRLVWFVMVFPALLLNYFGQGALLLQNPEAVHNPFFVAAPNWALYPLVIIATMATIIASQAVISGAFSLTRQAVQLGYIPRMKIEQTSTKEIGQIYMPGINWTLMICCIGLVIGFGSSSNLAAAYGVGVTTDMVFTSILFAVVLRVRWKWSITAMTLLITAFLIMDLAFFGATIVKVPDGGWFPLVVAGLIFILMSTWKRGRSILAKQMQSSELPLELFLKDVEAHAKVKESKIKRVDGTAVYMYSNPNGTPPALLHNIKHNRVIHKDVVLLSVKTIEAKPYVPRKDQVEVESLGKGFYRIVIHSGFAQSVNIPRSFKEIDEPGLNLKMQETSFFLGSERVLASNKKASGMAKWRNLLFGVMVRNEQRATAFFGLPSNRVVELGAQVKI